MDMTPARAVVLSIALAATPALAQPGAQRPHGQAPMPHAKPFQRPHAAPQPGARMDWAERQRLREDLRSHNRDFRRDSPPADSEPDARRREEIERLREQVRGGQMSREEAIRRYRERFGAEQSPRGDPPARHPEVERLREAVREGRMSPQEARERLREERMRRATEAGRLSPEERDQLRRDILDANRNLERR